LGALRGSIGTSRFYVAPASGSDEAGTGKSSRMRIGVDLPEGFPAAAMKRIRANVFEPLSPDDDANDGHGWCSMLDPMDLELEHEKVFFNEYVCLGLRIDRWFVPKPLLEAQLREAEANLLAKKGLDKLGKVARADLKLMVLKKLRRQLVPVTKSIDLVWSLESHVVHFFSQSPKMHLLAQELFEKTLRYRLVPEAPGTAAERRGLSAEERTLFDSLEQTTLAREEDAR
jgi:hypothetical protein